MKEYPSIPRSFEEMPGAYIFDKLDGRSTRMEWVRKKGWTKFGSRHQLLDEHTPGFEDVKPLFMSTLADKLAKVATDQRWESAIFFCEHWGAKTLAGIHEPGDPLGLTLFDVNPFKRGIHGPREFLKLFGDKEGIPTPKFLGQHNWTRGFVDRVWAGELEGITLEGVVGKVGEGHTLKRAKAKTKVWIELIKSRHTAEEAEKIINS